MYLIFSVDFRQRDEVGPFWGWGGVFIVVLLVCLFACFVPPPPPTGSRKRIERCLMNQTGSMVVPVMRGKINLLVVCLQ